MNHLKRIFIASLTLLTIACNNTPKQASIEGSIQNLPENVTEIIIRTQEGIQNIPVKNGQFKDSINYKGEYAFLQIGREGKMLFLDEDTQLKIVADANDLNKSIEYSGNGEKESNYLKAKENITEELFTKIESLNTLEESAFNNYVNDITSRIETLINEYDGMNPTLVEKEKEMATLLGDKLQEQYKLANRTKVSLETGTPSPEFNNLENYNGGTTSLKDLKGSYVYIDIWATWCPPCIAEIPYLKQIEEKFHSKNIKFVSLSIDNDGAKEKWKTMIKEKEMGGIQLFNNKNDLFVNDYQVTGIPRFILIDKEGNIMDANAPRPSNPELSKTLEKLF
ncbi:TlpA disulfide reductase family protein [Wenyingzhuangia sp. 2_MG-2023]|uniref:TlpA family protein disulfide reductase n=1 Tax=Wenyingzhuangia sp. 2_MG-2023 TaxID=3062639 RepID=UPI0026E17A0D|nr:TlpA disulfide reductase family protein [Wenyingzhuangia sp. 2_MG-2023]MDO6737832.1 TlpA disulfide reductase family protein [Wenyingzhuangia sp. 2_MG-2023]